MFFLSGNLYFFKVLIVAFDVTSTHIISFLPSCQRVFFTSDHAARLSLSVPACAEGDSQLISVCSEHMKQNQWGADLCVCQTVWDGRNHRRLTEMMIVCSVKHHCFQCSVSGVWSDTQDLWGTLNMYHLLDNKSVFKTHRLALKKAPEPQLQTQCLFDWCS